MVFVQTMTTLSLEKYVCFTVW